MPQNSIEVRPLSRHELDLVNSVLTPVIGMMVPALMANRLSMIGHDIPDGKYDEYSIALVDLLADYIVESLSTES